MTNNPLPDTPPRQLILKPKQMTLWQETVVVVSTGQCSCRDFDRARQLVAELQYRHSRIVTANKWQGVYGAIRHEAALRHVPLVLVANPEQHAGYADFVVRV